LLTRAARATQAACTELAQDEHCVVFSGGNAALQREPAPGWLSSAWAVSLVRIKEVKKRSSECK